MARAGEHAMRPLLAHCHLASARSACGRGAVEHLTAARTLCRDMDMRTWQARGEAVLGERGAAG